MFESWRLLDSLGSYRDNTQFRYDRVARQWGCATIQVTLKQGNSMPLASR